MSTLYKGRKSSLSYVGVNSVGLKRRGFSQDTINQILDIYRTIYNKNLNISQALATIEEDSTSLAESNDILGFYSFQYKRNHQEFWRRKPG
jgi:UDP-N-acetylglucosamine acyltransferase